MQRIFALLLTVALFGTNSYAQDSSRVSWTVSALPGTSGHYTIRYKGLIQAKWRLYAFASRQDDINGIQVRFNDPAIKSEETKILSPETKIQDPVFEKQLAVSVDSISFSQEIAVPENAEKLIKVELEYYVGKEADFIPELQKFTVSLNGETVPAVAADKARIKINSIDWQHPVSDIGKELKANFDSKSADLWTIFLLGFFGGLIALLTPCVFPMIPLTVSFFTKRALSRKQGVRNAFLYGFFIFLIYILLSVPFHFIDKLDPEILNNISTNVVLNLIFFAIFIVFALSFFGLYEIGLPSSFSNKADNKANSGKVLGIFFMALTLAIVSFSCTGPILGSLLAGSLTADGGAWQLTAGMGGFGIALALPFALFALFPHWLQSLPKSGGWLTTVKIVLGFAELALALKFLSNADMVSHWGLLKREVFIAVWIIIGILLSLYLFGIIRFKHEGPVSKIGTGRKIFGLLVAAFTIYLIPGITDTKAANLKLISGFPPPLYYSVYARDSECIMGLNCTHDYDEGLELARKLNKPVLLDFTGYACVNCRRMEEKVWTDDQVYKIMKDSFIVVSLYVDDKKKLPVSKQFTYRFSDGSTKEIVTVGDKWATFETENFQNNAQPLYAVIDTNERLLTFPAPYTPDVKTYLEWLKGGLEVFNRK
jgi:thiol:disulfide interchange protein DsbD